MKPERIILIRHGQSQGNVDKSVYSDTPDYTLPLTPIGRGQAATAGKELAALLGDTSAQFYGSPFWRTRETYQEIVKSFPNSKFKYVPNPNYYEDPRLREQEWGHYRKDEHDQSMLDERDGYGHFYYRFPDGESCADVYDRVSDFLNTLHREFTKPYYPKNTVIVTHGMTMRVFLMRWFHWSVEQFEEIANPRNCEYFILKLVPVTGKYVLTTQLRKHEIKHPYQFKWNL